MATIFTRIVKGEIPSYKIAETEDFYAFLDINPLSKGHTLVIPKLETYYIFELGDSQLSSLTLFAKKVALAIDKAIDCQRVGVAVLGLDVPHTHIHLIPLVDGSEINFSRPKLQFSPEEMQKIADTIAQNINY